MGNLCKQRRPPLISDLVPAPSTFSTGPGLVGQVRELGWMMEWGQLGFQDASSPVMEEFVFFHDFTMTVLIMIISFVGVAMSGPMKAGGVSLNTLEGQVVECVWTLIPAVILVQIAVPSLLLLYMLDENSASALTIKAVGHQWYWSYEYSDFWRESQTVEFDSYLQKEGEATRLLEADNAPAIPVSAQVRVLVGSADVLHAWALPSFGVKADACPGRLNQVKFSAHRPGVFFGQCSEICGANHSFMPIALEVGAAEDFVLWVEAQLMDRKSVV